MNKYIKAALLFLFYWVVVGTGSGIILDILGSALGLHFSLSLIGIVPGFAYGIYSAYKTITKKDEK